MIREVDQLDAIRNGYGEGIERAAREDRDVIAIDADLAESTRSLRVRKVDPKRFFYAGICEQNMIGVAAGLALEGKKVFASSFAIFVTGRPFEQIRHAVCYNNVPVKIVGSHAGIHTGEDGASAQATEDIGAMRTLPNMNIIVPADSIEAREATLFLKDFREPCYMRTNRNPTPLIYREGYRFEFGKGVLLREGKDAAIIACGALVAESLKAARLLEKEGIDTRVINMHTIKPIDKDIILKAARETKAIITAEDHQIVGGLGSAVSEVLAENGAGTKLTRIGLKGHFGESGESHELYKKYGLDAEGIVRAVKESLKK